MYLLLVLALTLAFVTTLVATLVLATFVALVLAAFVLGGWGRGWLNPPWWFNPQRRLGARVAQPSAAAG